MISWIDFRDFYEINTGLYGSSQTQLPPADMMVALMTIARASKEVEAEIPSPIEARSKAA